MITVRGCSRPAVSTCVAKHGSRPGCKVWQHRASSVACRSQHDEDGSPLDDVEAMAEAHAIYVQATKLATLETAMELETSWQSEAGSTNGSTSSEVLEQQQQQQADEELLQLQQQEAEDLAKKERKKQRKQQQVLEQPTHLLGPPPSETAVVALLQEYGLSQREAASLYKDIARRQATAPQEPSLSLSQLASRLIRWQRVLPGVNPARLAVSDVELLYADIPSGLRALISLVSLMPGRDASSMVEKLPRLLWTEDLQAKMRVAVDTLVRLHPSGDEEIVLDMIAEHPTLILRMGYYTNARMIDELPLEIQNMMVVADQSLAQTFRYYRNRRTNYKAELTSHESMTSD